MNNKSYIGIFQIGPVEEFINKSKKTIDFWSSSYLMSHLISIAINSIGDDKLIYPSPDQFFDLNKIQDDDLISIFPNRFVVLFDEKDDAEEKMEEAQKRIEEEINTFSNKINQFIGTDVYLPETFRRQLSNFFEIYWILYPYNIQKVYKDNYNAAEVVFNGRKSIRNFNYIEEPGYKCTLCGEREPLVINEGDSLDRKTIKNYWNSIRKKFGYIFKEGEHLCSICTIKRLFPNYIKNKSKKEVKVPSTSYITVSDFIFEILKKIKKDNSLQEKVKKLIDILFNNKDEFEKALDSPLFGNTLKIIEKETEGIDYDNLKEFIKIEGDYFYKDTYENLKNSTKIKSDNLKENLQTIIKVIDDIYKKFFTPSKYFAVIQYDGDNIGKLISEQKSIEEHKNLSENIANFSKSVINLENKYLCKVIYSGGDQGLVFVSLKNLIDVYEELRNTFSSYIKDKNLSFSITIAHYAQPLQEVIDDSDESLRVSKKVYDKNSFTISIIKRSGEAIKITLKNKIDDYCFVDFMKCLINIYKNKYLSKRWWKDLTKYKKGFEGEENNTEIIDKKLLELEVKRLILRKKSKNIPENELIQMLTKIEKLINEFPVYRKIEEFTDFLAIIEFIAKEGYHV